MAKKQEWFNASPGRVWMTSPVFEEGQVYRVTKIEGPNVAFEKLTEVEVFDVLGRVWFNKTEYVDLGRKSVYTEKMGEQFLTRTEIAVLTVLCRKPDIVVPQWALLTECWGPEYKNDLQYLRVWISRIRDRLGETKAHKGQETFINGISTHKYIRTVSGIGYMLCTEEYENVQRQIKEGREPVGTL